MVYWIYESEEVLLGQGYCWIHKFEDSRNLFVLFVIVARSIVRGIQRVFPDSKHTRLPGIWQGDVYAAFESEARQQICIRYIQGWYE
jgi:hypothetical protein